MWICRLFTQPLKELVLCFRDCGCFDVQHTFEDVGLAAVADGEVSHGAFFGEQVT